MNQHEGTPKATLILHSLTSADMHEYNSAKYRVWCDRYPTEFFEVIADKRKLEGAWNSAVRDVSCIAEAVFHYWLSEYRECDAEGRPYPLPSPLEIRVTGPVAKWAKPEERTIKFEVHPRFVIRGSFYGEEMNTQ